jgi:hypothetical protein
VEYHFTRSAFREIEPPAAGENAGRRSPADFLERFGGRGPRPGPEVDLLSFVNN